MKLIPIPQESYEEYRLSLMFDCYKWDPQFQDHNTIAKYALVLSEREHEELTHLTEALDLETRAAEEYLNQHPEYVKPLRLTGKIKKNLKKMQSYRPDEHIRLMRYDFHPTADGTWAVSEVNSDVPGGFAEGTLMLEAALKALGNQEENRYGYKSFGQIFVDRIEKKVKQGGKICLIHCTSYSDDRQVLQFLGEQLQKRGFSVIYAAADHLKFEQKKAICILDGNEGEVDAIIRFTPLEWLTDMKTRNWKGYFDTETLSCNHPAAIYAQTKCFPFVWDILEKNGISMSFWRQLLPETIEVSAAKGKEGYIYKPVYGRVGEKISIREACREEEYKAILKDVRRHPKKYLAQKQFISKPLSGELGDTYHVCLGSYAVDGKHAGYYARISESPRIDSNAADIPVLIEKECGNCRRKWTGEQIGEYRHGKIGDCNQKGILTESGCLAENRKTEKMLYKIWAPEQCLWRAWVRPVPFMMIQASFGKYHLSELKLPEIRYLQQMGDAGSERIQKQEYCDTAIIVDLPGAESVMEGLALAKCGFRPVPVYNGTLEQEGARATVDNQSVAYALYLGAKELKKTEICPDAPPAFLIDSSRLLRYKMEESLFDNSWDVYPQDLPSAEYLLEHGIRKIIIVGEKVSRDLKKILQKYRRKKIQILFTKGYEAPKEIRGRRT